MSALRRLLFMMRENVILKKNIRNLSTNNHQDVNIISSPCEDVDIPSITIPELIYSRIEKFNKFTASVCAETHRSYTFEQLRVKARNLSKALRKILKLEKGDTIAILLTNSPEYPLCVLGSLEAGLVVTTINPLYTPEEISRQLSDSSSKAIITFTDLYATAKSAANLSKRQLPIVTIKSKNDELLPEGAIIFNELLDSKIDLPDFQPGSADDIAILPYSSGTTGLPKGVQLTHRNIVSNIHQATCPDLDFSLPPTDNFQDIIPAVLPMFHIYGLTVTMFAALNSGCRTITLSKFTPDLYISVLKNYKTSIIYAAPPLVLFLTLHPGVKKEYLESVRIVSSGAAPLGALDEERFLQKSPKNTKIVQGYGLTETSPVVTVCSVKLFEQGKATGSIGQLVPNTLAKIVAIDDGTGKPLGPHQPGELLVKGPQVMKNYHNKEEETRNAFLDGWFRTGDLGHYNEDGAFYITDRLKELIKVKGFQVAPAELEEIIRDFPAVDDAAVIGVAHDSYGELPRAYVVPKKGEILKAAELAEYVAEKVASYKQLKGGIEIVDSIPKNSAGKILRRQLKLAYERK
uniref:Luciferin 4-monooxygenase n=1 Tax=Anoplophora glabripennis TaxID=217634 RepID=V5GTJ7_ANOGL